MLQTQSNNNNEPKINHTALKYQKVNKVLPRQNMRNREKMLKNSISLKKNNDDDNNDDDYKDDDYDYEDENENDHKDMKDDNNDNKVISIKESEYNKMLDDINELQNINVLYEKENQRMVNKILEKDGELKDLRAQFYDKRESMVQEINRLKNLGQSQTFSFQPQQIQSEVLSKGQINQNQNQNQNQFQPTQSISNKFRTNIEKDSQIYNLQEYVFHLESQNRQKDDQLKEYSDKVYELEKEKVVFIKTIDNLKKQINQSQGQSQSENHDHIDNFDQQSSINSNLEHKKLIEELEEQSRIEKMQLTVQIQELRGRLEWYSKTQDRLDLVTAERDKLKTELQNFKINSKNESFLRQDSHSVSSQTTGKRNLQDIKRIK